MSEQLVEEWIGKAEEDWTPCQQLLAAGVAGSPPHAARYHFELLQTDELNQPTRGRLLCHHPDRDVVHRRNIQLRLPHTYTTFAVPLIPEGYEIVL